MHKTIALLLLPLAAALAGEGKVDPVLIPPVIDLRNTADPVTDKPVVRAETLDWNGIRLHFATAESRKTFTADPGKYLAKLHVKLVKDDQGHALVDLANETCPVSGKAVGETVLDRDGVRTHLCCGRCPAGLEKNPATAYDKLGYGWVAEVIDLRNTTCPVTGKALADVSKPVVAEEEGIRVHFCDAASAAEFRKDPARIFRQLDVDIAKLKQSMLRHSA